MRYRRACIAFIGALLFLIIMAVLRYGSLANTLAACRGQRVVLENSVIDLGYVEAKVTEFEVIVANLTSTEVRLVGFEDC